MVAAANPNLPPAVSVGRTPGSSAAEPAGGDRASDSSPAFPTLSPLKLLSWVALACGVYAGCLLIGIVIARGIELALGWSVPP